MRTFLVNLALKFQGVPYIWGGSTPAGFDCSGFVIWVYQVFDIMSAGDCTAHDLYSLSLKTNQENQIHIGDLVFYGNLTHISHVMIYIGNGMCVGASGGGKDCTTPEIAKRLNAMVKIKKVDYRKDFVCYGRLTVKD